MKRGIYLILLIIAFLPLDVYALGVIPGKVVIPFSPLREEVISFEVLGPKIIKAETDCENIIKINRTIKANEENRAKVIAYIKLPEIMEPGLTHCGISITEVPEKDAQLAILIRIVAIVEIDVPYPGKYAKMSISADNAMPDQDLRIYTNIINLGTEDLDAKADVFIRDYKNNTIMSKKTESSLIGSKSSKQFITILPAGSLDSGKYYAKAIYDYGKEIISVETHFVVGLLDLELVNYTNAIKSGTISQFYLLVTSLWGNPLENTYAEIKIYDNESKVILITKTPSITIAPYSTEVMSGFIDATNIKPGNYSADIILRSNNNEFINKVEIIVEEKEALKKDFILSPYLFILIIIAIILTDAVYIMMLRKKNLANQLNDSGITNETH